MIKTEPDNHPPLDPSRYVTRDIFEQEERQIFEPAWLFAGFTDQLDKENDFLTFRVGRHSIVVQRFQDGIKAFRNVCSHRFAEIQSAPCGNRALRCPYHGWQYDQNGVPIGIPGNREFFGLDEEGRKARSLEQFNVAICGRFVFVRMSANGPDLNDYLGHYAQILEGLSDLFEETYAEKQIDWDANWKIGIESVLEVYHVGPVHPESFAEMTRPGWDCEYEGPHSTGTSYLSEMSEKWWSRLIRKADIQASKTLINYDHFVIWPNLAVGLTRGANLSVQTYHPLQAEGCKLHYRLRMAKSDKSGKAVDALRRAAQKSLAEFNERVLEEDRIVSESCQRGMRQKQTSPIHGRNEGRIKHFHASIARAIE